MKISITLLFLLTVFCTSGKSLQISNVNPAADFQSLTLAHAQAHDGDTLYVEGTGIPYEGLTLTKKLVLIGPGYFLSENTDTHFNKKPALIKTNIVFETGSSGSKIIGFDLKQHGGDIIIKESNIAIKRNRLNNLKFYHKDINATYKDVLVSQNYIEGNIEEWRIGYDPLNLKGLIVSNNYINNVRLGPQDNNSAMSGLFENNIVNDLFQCYNCIVRNNIHLKSNTSGAYYVFEKKRFNDVYNNIMVLGAPVDIENYQLGTNNQFLINKSTIFVGLTSNSKDGQWQLRENSPGSEAGSDGTDCGMFGGATPYQLSGLPPLPVVYEIIGPDLETGKVTVKARAIK
jgi:hypothetical protein